MFSLVEQCSVRSGQSGDAVLSLAESKQFWSHPKDRDQAWRQQLWEWEETVLSEEQGRNRGRERNVIPSSQVVPAAVLSTGFN